MNRIHKAVLRKSLPYLMDNIYDVSEILDYLYASEVVSSQHKEDISDMPTRSKRKQMLFRALPTLGPLAFQSFLDALHGSAHEFVADELRRVVASMGLDSNTPRGFSQDCLRIKLSDESLRRRITEQELSRIAGEVSPDDQPIIAQIMGLSQGRLDQYRADEPHSTPNQTFKIFCDWLAREGSRATIGQFVHIMNDAGIDSGAYEGFLSENFGNCTLMI